MRDGGCKYDRTAIGSVRQPMTYDVADQLRLIDRLIELALVVITGHDMHALEVRLADAEVPRLT